MRVDKFTQNWERTHLRKTLAVVGDITHSVIKLLGKTLVAHVAHNDATDNT